MKIVYATDGSNHARIAELILSKTPRWRDADIDVVTVLTPPALGAAAWDPQGGATWAAEIDQAWEDTKKTAQETVHEVSQRMTAAGIRAKAVLLEGDVAEQLLDYTNDVAADMIAIGSRGFGAFRSFFLGSVARRLVSYSPVSVLVGRGSEGEEAASCCSELEAKDKLDVLVCVDGSEGSAFAIDKIARQGHNAFHRAIALCAEPLNPLPLGINPANLGNAYRYDHDRAVAIVKEACDLLCDCSEETVGETNLGRPSDVLIRAAKEENVDLVTVGATRHGFIERFLLGSVSFEVATAAPCSVLVVRPDARVKAVGQLKPATAT